MSVPATRGKSIQTQETAVVAIADIEKMADAVAASKLFGCKNKDEAMTLMLISQAEGMHPMTAVQEFHIIQGRPARKAESMLTRFQRSGGSVKWLEYSDTEVSAKFSHPQGGEVTVMWTIDRARAIGLADKDSWKKYPAPMLRSRCISEGVRTVYPGATGGMYTPEEIEELPPKEMGAAEVLPAAPPPRPIIAPYPDEKLEGNLSIWRDLVTSGTKTTDAIIKNIKSKYTMTPEQEKKIKALANNTQEQQADK